MKTITRTRIVALAAVAAVALGLLCQPVTAQTPAPLTQLTSGGCCTRPFWSNDSQRVLYIDKPDAKAPTGIYGVDLAYPQAPQLVTPRIALYTHGLSLAIDLKPGSTTLERVSDGQRWTVPAAGAQVSVSPNEKRIAWTQGQGTGTGTSPEARVTRIQVANLDGSSEKTLATIRGGSISGWISDDALLIGSRGAPSTREQVLSTLSVLTGELKELVRAENLRGQSLSPDGIWLAFQVAPEPDASKNGVWLMRTDGSGKFRVPAEMFGPYQWRDAHRLLIVPFRPAAENHELWELDVTTRQTRRLIDPLVTAFKINDGDWVVSPDGRKVAFVSARDRNLWLLALPE
jgi:Tol biopolymer transport system component